ncbi:MAG: PadR family transcriptional regulator [Actinomycetota bacterium]|jgi:DNA-binding PadR family transcriptional regulator|nr:PadR family transcriptional regulator [Actinomycetota bacterium]
MLELAILGVLEEHELHGYEIRRRLREEVGVFANVSFGSLYPALSRLERSGALVAADGERRDSPVPMTGSLSGERAALRARRAVTGRGRRNRKVYRVTDEGRRQFAALLAAEPQAGEDARGFGLRLAFARYLPPPARLRLLERRRAQLLDRLAAVQRSVAAAQLDRYARCLIEHAADSTARDIAWLDQLIESERLRTTAAEQIDPSRASITVPALLDQPAPGAGTDLAVPAATAKGQST